MNKTIFLTITILLSLSYWQAEAQFTESFDTNIPSEWTVIDNDGQGTSWQFHAGNGYLGDGGLWIYQEDFEHDDYLISPQFIVTSGLTDHISFYAGGSGVNFLESFEVKVSTTGANPSDFNTVLGSETTIANVDTQGDYVNYAYNLSAFDGQEVYVAVVATSTRSFRLYLDEFTVDALPRCPKPSSLNIQNLTDSSVDLNWNLGGNEDEWSVKYGPQGFNPETQGDLIAVTGTPNSFIDNLEEANSYDVYIQAICGTQGESEMAGPFTFKTLCTPATLPFLEGFEENYLNGANLENCWSQEVISNTHWKVNNSIVAGNRGPRTGLFNIYLPKGSDTWMFYPIEVQSGISYTLSLHARQSNTEGADIAASYGNSENAEDMIHEIFPTTEITNGDYQEVSGSFMSANSGVIYIGIRGHLISGFFPFYLSVDDISITESQTCLKPTSLQIDNVTPDTATISWNPENSETEWLIKYGEPGFNPIIEGSSLQVNGNPNATITNLIPANIYSVFVQSLCGGTDGNSFFAGPITLKTTPINDDLCNATALTVDGLCVNGSYTNVGATLQRDEPQGSCYDAAGSQTVWFSFVAPSSGNVTVTTDFEGGTLEDTEVAVFESATDCNNLDTLGTEIGCDEDGGIIGDGFLSVVTLTNLVEGNTYFIQVNGFESFGEGTFEGTFCIEVQDDGVDCITPSNISVSDITATTALVNWTPVGDETEWEIKYGPTGFDPLVNGESVFDNDGVPNEILTDLEVDSAYDVFVRALCDANTQSDFEGPHSFSTITLSVDQSNLLSFTYYPNPVQNSFIIHSNKRMSNVQFFAINGAILKEVAVDANVLQLNISNFSNGIYFMNATFEDGSKIVQKLVKQ
ncbi:T9SS-dependent choice-of-anchor J family protein [Aequorivita viscosa]|uniref:Por secretion system C-terminal sorting domain-containing protein n=1 Tax=Aequorivita viscosa TaxID=797419 RepID=A0A1M6M7W0_9FLAO|nr:choice-of-anchor J domain-containing protein [Aequorivita viscosa]SDX27882.1 Por secretion system C-terminal sorting domain-containing protein [Aequorivita viscosa]SHJ79514.1 Por secretion system C-terminal sorting domain-containing protein [Aequorivita viscosa]